MHRASTARCTRTEEDGGGPAAAGAPEHVVLCGRAAYRYPRTNGSITGPTGNLIFEPLAVHAAKSHGQSSRVRKGMRAAAGRQMLQNLQQHCPGETLALPLRQHILHKVQLKQFLVHVLARGSWQACWCMHACMRSHVHLRAPY